MVNVKDIGAVVIGRNEGGRLNACLTSLLRNLNAIVYVDSGSTDGSADLAIKMGVSVMLLDMAQPFTAARARNVGFKALTAKYPDLKYVQFIDGDCQLLSGWLDSATHFLEGHPGYAVVCGRRRECFPEKSVYNQLCDIEWDTPVGDASACGGDALIRINAFMEVEGYNDGLIAGEEPDMCFRLRQKGWKIYRLDTVMTLHDARMLKFKQWWQRSKRAGFAYGEGSFLHGNSEEKYWLKETYSIIFWGGLFPAVLITLGCTIDPGFFLGFLAYPLQIIKVSWFHPLSKSSWKISTIYAFFVIIAKFPQFTGVISYHAARLLKHKTQIIEYK